MADLGSGLRAEIKIPVQRIAPWSNWLVPARILVLGFATAILLGAVLLSLPLASKSGIKMEFVDALFTATSAVCVTGLVVVDTATAFSLFGQIVIMLLIQIGGLGIMTMTALLALVMGRKINLRERLLMQEALNTISLAGVVRLARSILLVTLLIETIGALFLAFRFIPQFGLGRGLYYSIFHSIAAFCNAGFDLMGDVTGPFSGFVCYATDPIVSLVVAFLIIVGGIGFTVIADLYNQSDLRRISVHSKLVITVTAILLLVGTTLFFLLEYSHSLANMGLGGKLLASFFQSVTTRTAGFNTVPMGAIHPSTVLIFIIFMFIGASPGGTGGGIKTTTLAALLLGMRAVISGNKDVTAYKRMLPPELVFKALTITVLSAFLVIDMVILLSLTEQTDILTLLFETVSAFGTVGLSLGFTPQLTVTGKMLIIFTMFAGRLGPLTIALAVWRSRTAARFHYPEERMLIG